MTEFKRFTKPQALKQIGRELLEGFFERCNGAMEGIGLPPCGLRGITGGSERRGWSGCKEPDRLTEAKRIRQSS